MTEFMDMDSYDPQDMQLAEREKEAIENMKNAQTRGRNSRHHFQGACAFHYGAVGIMIFKYII